MATLEACKKDRTDETSLFSGYSFRREQYSSFAYLVSQNPQSHGHRPSDYRVGGPEWEGQNRSWIENIASSNSNGCADGSSEKGDGQVPQRFHGICFKAVRWNDLAELVRAGKVLV